MSSEKNPEVVGCDASIMKNVWEIREREYIQKIQLEQERLEKSALPSINKDWANRMTARTGGYKRVERKAKPPDTPTDNTHWKSKEPPALRPPPTRVGGSGPLGRLVGQGRGVPTPSRTDKEKPVQDKSLSRLQLLMYISQTQPSAMVWGKSWKYNKSLPSPAEGSKDWGQCWMFATQQPCSEAGQPWSKEANMTGHHNLHLWRKPDYREVESRELDLVHLGDEWEVSWKKSENQNKEDSPANGENVFHPGFFTMLVESQYHNELRCSSEWSEAWRATKSANQQGHFTNSNDSLMSQSVPYNQNMDNEMGSKWEESWRFINHHGDNNSEVHQPKKALSPEWASSWRAANIVVNNRADTDPSLQEDHINTCGDRSHNKQFSIQSTMPVSREEKFNDLYMQLCFECKGLSEWNKSWQMIKSISKPSAEIEKVLKAPMPKIDTTSQAQEVEKISKMQYSTPEKADPYYEQLKHDIIYRPKREFPQSKLFLLKHLEKNMPFSEWRDSWKVIKHRMRMEKRQMRLNPLKPFRESDSGEDMKPCISEWKDVWKFTCKPLRQEPDQWQQDWSIIVQVRENGARLQNQFAPLKLPKNGPTGEQSWGDSWKFSRKKHRSEPGVGKTQISQGRSCVVSQDYECSWVQRRHNRVSTDWQAAWMVSETQFHHDKPSLTQWRESWKWSVYHTQPWTEQIPRENWMNELMELKPMKEFSLQRTSAKISRSFDHHMFRERYPEKEWSSSWRAGSLLNHQSGQHGSSGVTGQSFKNTIQQQLANEYGSRWGRSFRLANPMPQMDQHWVESYPNPCCYSTMWSKGKEKQYNVITNFGNPATLKLWGNSHHFLQKTFTQKKNKSKTKEPTDPMMIMTKKTKTRKHLPSNTDKDKQSDKKWAGCHLLGKTQPRPKKGSGSVRKLKPEDDASAMFFEEWAESWRFLVRPSTLKKQPYFKKLIGWDESWKFLIPLYQSLNSPKGK